MAEHHGTSLSFLSVRIFGKGVPVVNYDSSESERPWLLLAPQGLVGGGRG